MFPFNKTAVSTVVLPQTGNEELSLFTDDMILYIENHKDTTKTTRTH